MTAPTSTPPAAPARTQVKETLISLIIAFVMAFIFRAFIIEAFVIPTGSMAPTLLGQHVAVRSPQTGAAWTIDPRDKRADDGTPLAIQGTISRPLAPRDPMTREELSRVLRTRAGDRILVFKYLYSVYDPRRWDVVVFKAPHDPQTNYIKRLLGLPGEMPAIVDGDLFVRHPGAGEALTPSDNPWVLPGWQIQRKPERVQRAAWQDVFWSQYQPLSPVRDVVARQNFRSPWTPSGPGWSIEGRASYTYSGQGPAALAWDAARFPITDYYAYDQWMQAPEPGPGTFPVSDLNMAAGIRPEAATEGAGLKRISAVLTARRHEFRADIEGGRVTLRMRPAEGGGEYTVLGMGVLRRPLEAGRITNIEFWHADQALQLWEDGHLIAEGRYDWSPDERLRHALNLTAEQVFSQDRPGSPRPGTLSIASHYTVPQLRWEFEGGPVTLFRVGVQRDLHYQASWRGRDDAPARQASPVSTFAMGPEHFFVCGDNSPASLDARLWPEADPWVQEQIDRSPGVVPRQLMIGRAFFVYFPALVRGKWGLPVPDFGNLRWIW
jgi:signal peptidase I